MNKKFKTTVSFVTMGIAFLFYGPGGLLLTAFIILVIS